MELRCAARGLGKEYSFFWRWILLPPPQLMYKSSCFSSIKWHWVFPFFFAYPWLSPLQLLKEKWPWKKQVYNLTRCGMFRNFTFKNAFISSQFFWNTLAFCRYLLVWNTGHLGSAQVFLVNHPLHGVSPSRPRTNEALRRLERLAEETELLVSRRFVWSVGLIRLEDILYFSDIFHTSICWHFFSGSK